MGQWWGISSPIFNFPSQSRKEFRGVGKKVREAGVFGATVIIVRVPSIKIPDFFAQHRPERDMHRIQNNHTFILGVVASYPNKRFFHKGLISLLRCIRLCKFQNCITQQFRDRRKRKNIETGNYQLIFFLLGVERVFRY